MHQFMSFLLLYVLAFLALSLIVLLFIGFRFSRKMVQCEACFKLHFRRDVMPVSTYRRGVMMMCAPCARSDREMAYQDFRDNPPRDH